jgi:hypothetical protein
METRILNSWWKGPELIGVEGLLEPISPLDQFKCIVLDQRNRDELNRLRSKAQSAVAFVFATNSLQHYSLFKRNIIAIFEPKPTSSDSSTSKRSKATRRRCKKIHSLLHPLSPDEIVSWAIGFNSTVWSQHSWLISDIPRKTQSW